MKLWVTIGSVWIFLDAAEGTSSICYGWQCRFGSAGLAAQLVNTGDNVAVLATWSPGFALQAPPFNYC